MSKQADRIDHRLRVAIVVAVGGLTFGAFWASFAAITAYAKTTGTFPDGQEWLAPLLVDTFIVAGSLAGWRRSRVGQNPLYPWALVAAGTLVSVALNVAHAPDRLHAQAVAMIPPLALLLLFHLLLQELRASHVPTERAAPVKVPEESKRSLPDRSLSSERPTALRSKTAESPKPNGGGTQRQRAMVVLREQPELKVPEVAAAARVSERTVRNAKADLAREGS